MAYAMLATRNTTGLHPNFRGLGFLGDTIGITPEDAVSQALTAEGGRDINPRDATGWLSPTNPGWASVLESGQLSASAFSASCTTMPAPSVNLFQTASGLALGTTAAGVGILGATHVLPAVAIPVVGIAIAAAGIVISIVDVILAHHSAAVREEQQLGCAAIAAWNNSITLIDTAVANGQMTPDAASVGLDHLYSKVSSFLAPSVSHSPYCSADCEQLIAMHAIVIFKKARFAALAAQQQTQAATLVQQANQAQASGDTATANVLRAQAAALQPSTGIPLWAWALGLGFLAWEFF